MAGSFAEAFMTRAPHLVFVLSVTRKVNKQVKVGQQNFYVLATIIRPPVDLQAASSKTMDASLSLLGRRTTGKMNRVGRGGGAAGVNGTGSLHGTLDTFVRVCGTFTRIFWTDCSSCWRRRNDWASNCLTFLCKKRSRPGRSLDRSLAWSGSRQRRRRE
jgi:hypothetical protein